MFLFLIQVIIILVLIVGIMYYLQNFSINADALFGGNQDLEWCNNQEKEGNKCTYTCALGTEVDKDYVAMTYCNDDFGYEYIPVDSHQADCIVGQKKVSCKKHFQKEGEDFNILKNQVAWDTVKNKNNRDKMCEDDFGPGWEAADLPPTGSGASLGFGKGYCVKTSDYEQIKTDPNKKGYCKLNEKEDSKCWNSCVPSSDAEDIITAHTYCNNDFGEGWFADFLVKDGCETGNSKRMCIKPTKNIKKWKNDNLTWDSPSVNKGDLNSLNETCKKDFGPNWEHYALRRNGGLFVGYCINNSELNKEGDPNFVLPTSSWGCLKNDDLKGVATIWWGHTQGDAKGACDQWFSGCQKDCMVTDKINFGYIVNGHGKTLSVSQDENNNGSWIITWENRNEDGQKWALIKNYLVNKRGKYLSISNNDVKKGAWVVLADKNDTNTQQWCLEGEYIKLCNYPDKYLNTQGNSSDNGARLILWDKVDEKGSKWTFKF